MNSNKNSSIYFATYHDSKFKSLTAFKKIENIISYHFSGNFTGMSMTYDFKIRFDGCGFLGKNMICPNVYAFLIVGFYHKKFDIVAIPYVTITSVNIFDSGELYSMYCDL